MRSARLGLTVNCTLSNVSPLAHRGHMVGAGRQIAFVGVVGPPGTSRTITHRSHS